MQKSVISFLFSMLAAVLLSVILSLVYSLLGVMCSFPSSANVPVNLVIKLISITLGCFMFVKNEKGALYGLLFGAIYFIISAIVFNIISNDWQISLFTLANILYCAFVGMIVGVIKINIKSN